MNAQQALFASLDSYPAGTGPNSHNSLQAADFNGDGNLDLAFASNDQNVWILLGKKDGTFQAPVPVPLRARGNAIEVAVGDVNRDGKLDLVVVTYASSFNGHQSLDTQVSLLYGNGDGTFKPSVDLGMPGAYYVALADLNGDGNLDLVIAAPILKATVQGTVQVYLGLGNGSFTVHASWTVTNVPDSEIMVADFNNDRKLDLAINTEDGVLLMFMSKGGGDFDAPTKTYVGRTARDGEILVSDFNLDGLVDLAVSQYTYSGQNGYSFAINVLIGKGDGTFLPPITLSVPGQPEGIVTADFDGDGILDLFAGGVVLPGKGDGTFRAAVNIDPFGVLRPPSCLTNVVGDFNHDGKPDLACGYEDLNGKTTIGGIAVLLNGEPPFYIRSVVNAASRLSGNIARGEIISIIGNGLGPATLVAEHLTPGGLVDTTLAGVQAIVSGRPAPILSVQTNQIDAVVEYTAGAAPTVWVQYNGKRTNLISLVTNPAAPGIFAADGSGTGQGAILNEDGTLNSAANPAAKGSVITFFATGEGLTNPFGVDGKLADSPAPVPVLPVVVGINDNGAELLYAGGIPGVVAGVMEVVARVPSDAPSGSLKISIGLGGFFSQAGVTVAIQ